MTKIDTNQWKQFKIFEIFQTVKVGSKLQVPTGAAVPQKMLKIGNTPRITASGINNGVVGYYKNIEDEPNYRVYCNFISCSFLGTVFYQQQEASLDMKVHCLKPIGIELTNNVALFLVTAIRKKLQNSKYSDQISSTVLPYIELDLPVDKTGNPDFAYMASYMQNLESVVSSSLTALRSAKSSENCTSVDVHGWQEFHLYDIFNIDTGTKLDKAKMDTSVEEICFVGRSNFNNGITQKVKKISGLEPYPQGCLTLALGGAYLGSCFVQEEPFYTSQNVVVLIPKNDMSFLCKQFIATVIFRESQNNYQAFIKELNAHIKRDFVIKLPVISKDVIDYEFIEKYMLKIQERTIHFFSTLSA